MEQIDAAIVGDPRAGAPRGAERSTPLAALRAVHDELTAASVDVAAGAPEVAT